MYMFHTVWLLCDGKNAAFFFINSPSLTIVGEHGKRHVKSAHKAQAVSDWSKPNSLGTISAFCSIENIV